jgi:hypothetical protein
MILRVGVHSPARFFCALTCVATLGAVQPKECNALHPTPLRYCARTVVRIVSVSEVDQAERDDYSTPLAIASRREMRH